VPVPNTSSLPSLLPSPSATPVTWYSEAVSGSVTMVPMVVPTGKGYTRMKVFPVTAKSTEVLLNTAPMADSRAFPALNSSVAAARGGDKHTHTHACTQQQEPQPKTWGPPRTQGPGGGLQGRQDEVQVGACSITPTHLPRGTLRHAAQARLPYTTWSRSVRRQHRSHTRRGVTHATFPEPPTLARHRRQLQLRLHSAITQRPPPLLHPEKHSTVRLAQGKGSFG
jgi:hypothetical protein